MKKANKKNDRDPMLVNFEKLEKLGLVEKRAVDLTGIGSDGKTYRSEFEAFFPPGTKIVHVGPVKDKR